jgi:hypothetical protein
MRETPVAHLIHRDIQGERLMDSAAALEALTACWPVPEMALRLGGH